MPGDDGSLKAMPKGSRRVAGMGSSIVPSGQLPAHGEIVATGVFLHQAPKCNKAGRPRAGSGRIVVPGTCPIAGWRSNRAHSQSEHHVHRILIRAQVERPAVVTGNPEDVIARGWGNE
jgi:hypothetical protein